jgi:hypothetical protein
MLQQVYEYLKRPKRSSWAQICGFRGSVSTRSAARLIHHFHLYSPPLSRRRGLGSCTYLVLYTTLLERIVLLDFIHRLVSQKIEELKI